MEDSQERCSLRNQERYSLQWGGKVLRLETRIDTEVVEMVEVVEVVKVVESGDLGH